MQTIGISRIASTLLVGCAVVLAPASSAGGRVVTVPLDRSGSVPGTLRLEVSGRDSRRGSGTVLMLDGTLRGRATRRVSDLSFELDAFDPRRVVTFDMRGTGSSQLSCDAFDGTQPSARAVADCATQLGPRRAFYTVADDVADTEAVRAALGVERMTIYGFDYGARVAVAYAAAHPDRVARLVLDSPAGPDGADPFGRPTFAAIRRIAASTCVRSCRFTKDALGELTTLLGRLTHGPLHGRAFDAHGRAHDIAIGPAQVRDVLLASDASIVARVLWPAAVHAALAGDAAPLARLVHKTSRAAPLRLPGAALQLARMCGGRVAAQPPAGSPAVPADAFAPFTPELAAEVSPVGICAQWPDAPAAQALSTPPTVPTLVRSGEGSVTTPLEDAQALAERVPSARLLPLPLFGHKILSWSFKPVGDCPEDALRAFARDRPVQECRDTNVGVTWPVTPPSDLAAVAPRRGLPVRVGRTLHATQLTLLDAIISLSDNLFVFFDGDEIPGLTSPRQGGLHGGYMRTTADALRLHGYSYVPGVTLTGEISQDETAELRIGGSSAVHARLRPRKQACGERTCFVGRVGGRIVHLTVPGSA